MKTCVCCFIQKEESEFHIKDSASGRLMSMCKKCDWARKKIWRTNNRKEHLEKESIQRQKTKQARPWVLHYRAARRRCTDSKIKFFPRYGGRGIKFLMTIDEVRKIWSRDEAFSMKKPTIDRINNDGHYEISNVRFIELSENSRLGATAYRQRIKTNKKEIQK